MKANFKQETIFIALSNAPKVWKLLLVKFYELH